MHARPTPLALQPPLRDPALDFLSAEFDALRALRTPYLAPPEPGAPPLDNVNKCRKLLPAELPESLAALLALRARYSPPSEVPPQAHCHAVLDALLALRARTSPPS